MVPGGVAGVEDFAFDSPSLTFNGVVLSGKVSRVLPRACLDKTTIGPLEKWNREVDSGKDPVWANVSERDGVRHDDSCLENLCHRPAPAQASGALSHSVA